MDFGTFLLLQSPNAQSHAEVFARGTEIAQTANRLVFIPSKKRIIQFDKLNQFSPNADLMFHCKFNKSIAVDKRYGGSAVMKSVCLDAFHKPTGCVTAEIGSAAQAGGTLGSIVFDLQSCRTYKS